METIISNKQFDEERALYGIDNAEVTGCVFDGPCDGESALKEACNIKVSECDFRLRYPLWHVGNFELSDSIMTDTCRASLWYCTCGKITKTKLGGIKALRECSDISIKNCDINSAEFGWKTAEISIADSRIESEYLFLDSKNILLENVDMKGKYSFQYDENLTIKNSRLDTKDAFWHSKNTVVSDSVIKGEYLGWYSENLTLVNCHIIGTQPLCYCKNLKLLNCTMENCDLAFEYSSVEATIKGHVDSIKNPLEGVITVDSVGEIIRENFVKKCTGQVVLRA